MTRAARQIELPQPVLRRRYRMALSEFAARAFVGKAPCAKTLKAMIDRGDLPGEQRGSTYFVFVDQDGEPWEDSRLPPRTTGNPDADALLLAWESTRG